LIEWFDEPRITNFDHFKWFESLHFESVDKDYFKIVFRPVNFQEWQLFTNQKTENLARAISVMLANCQGRVAVETIFEALCRRTFTYDVNPETQQRDMPPRTLVNRAMFNLMLVIDRYQKLKISFMLQNNQAEADLVTEMS
jgi:hypothetical protein